MNVLLVVFNQLPLMQAYRQSIFIFAMVGLLLVGLFYWLNKDNPNHDWSETFEEPSEEPYGTYVVYELLQNYFSGHDFHTISTSIEQDLPVDSTLQNSNFIFIGQAIQMDSLDISQLVQFIENGNNAFFSTKTIPYELMDYFYEYECDQGWEDYYKFGDTMVQINLFDPVLRADSNIVYSQLYKNKADYYQWHYIRDTLLCTDTDVIFPLGEIDDNYVNFVRLPKGKGQLFLHTTPLAFTNVQLLEKERLDYVSKVFSYLTEGDIYWCEVNRISEIVGRMMNNKYDDNAPSRESPIKYILSQPSLAWAWYISLGLGILFIGFRAKRKQRIIPVLAENQNTSLEFISTIGKLHFIQNNHLNLCKEKMKLLLTDIRNRYSIPTNDLDEEFVHRLAAKSEVPKELITKILLYHKNISSSEFVTENTMVEFHQLIKLFDEKCK